MTTILFVPGFRDSFDSHDYASVLAAIESHGYATRFVPIDWRRTDLDSWTRQLESVYAKYDPDQTILAGFSFGAVTALNVAAQRLPSQLWLFSLSPCFAEDIPDQRQAWINDVGIRRVTRFEQMRFDSIIRNISCPVRIFYGEREARQWPDLKTRALAVQAAVSDCRLVEVPGCGHDVADPRYVAALAENL